MSLTKPIKTASSIAITTRLVLFYLISILFIMFCTNWFQFKALSEDLEFEDNDFLTERMTRLRAVIARNPDTPFALKDQIPANDSDRHIRYLVRVQDARGRTILESPGMSGLPVALFPPAVTGDQLGRGAKYRGAGGEHYLLNSAWAEAFGDPHFRLVQIALDVEDEHALMVKYQLKMGASVLIGLLMAAVLGIVITRKGLQPLQEMAATVAQISETDLHQRIRMGVWPKELDQLTLALDGMLGRLEDSFARLSEFSANLAHELRTPINNLRGEAEVALSRPRSNDEYRHIIESSIEECERLSRMVGDILFLARPEQGFVPHLIDARAETETLAEYYRTLADEQQITIAIQGGGTVSVDPPLFQRAVGNLISNALHYTPTAGRITVTLTETRGGRIDLSVEDNGMGVDASELPRVFDRFYRSPQARLRHNQGSGLGLAIVRSIMTLHGGTVTIASETGRGTVATLSFPGPQLAARQGGAAPV